MAKLNNAVKTFIVQRLAWFMTPEDVAKAVKEVFDVEISRQAVYHYDPTRPGAPQTWRQTFDDERKRFLTKIEDIPLANPAVRLMRLQRLADNAKVSKNAVLEASLIEQAAKEAGGAYEGRRRVTVEAKVEGELKHEHRFTAEDNANLLREALGALAEDAGGSGAPE